MVARKKNQENRGVAETQREKGPNTEFFLVCIFRIWTEYEDFRIQEISPNTVKLRPEKTPYLDTFHTVIQE